MSIEVAWCRCHFSSVAAQRVQKDKKDSEIRFTSGMPEMDRNLASAAFYVEQYIFRIYPIPALWYAIS